MWSAYTLIVQSVNQLNHFGKLVVSTKAEHTRFPGPSNSPKYMPNRNTCNHSREDMCKNAQNSTIPNHPIVETTHRCTYTRQSSSVDSHTVKYYTEIKYNHLDDSNKHNTNESSQTQRAKTIYVMAKNKETSSMMSEMRIVIFWGE